MTTIISGDTGIDKITDGTIVNADVNASAAIAGEKLLGAWVSFNQSTIRGSGNVSSVTDNGTGDYTVNFDTAMPDTNYSAVFTVTDGTAGTNMVGGAVHTKTTGAVSAWSAYVGQTTDKTLWDTSDGNLIVLR
jgi:hypothetical protein